MVVRSRILVIFDVSLYSQVQAQFITKPMFSKYTQIWSQLSFPPPSPQSNLSLHQLPITYLVPCLHLGLLTVYCITTAKVMLL